VTDFDATRARFILPPGQIYLDGNSLGPLPVGAEAAMRRALEDEWGVMAIGGWNRADWMGLPDALGDRIGGLSGRGVGTVTVGDTLSIRLFQALAAAVAMTDRKVVLTDSGNFPSDLYMAQGFVTHFGGDRVAGRGTRGRGRGADRRGRGADADAGRLPDRAQARHGGVDAQGPGAGDRHDLGPCPFGRRFRGGPRRDGGGFRGGLHLQVPQWRAGAPAFIYVAPRHADSAETVLNGWLGHAAPFAFEERNIALPRRRADARGHARHPADAGAGGRARRLGRGVDGRSAARSVALSERFIAAMLARVPGAFAGQPGDPDMRGSQVSFRFEHAYGAIQALIARGVVGDFRAPDIMRFGIAPLYNTEAEIDAAVEHVAEVMATRPT
jgi:kynureninase